MIMQPFADCAFEVFLRERDDGGHPIDPTRRVEVLKRFPGCLLRAIHFIHEKGDIHNDLKGDNILVHGDNILIADFGHAIDAGTGTGEQPENDAITRAGDIRSLGKIFPDILTVLSGLNIQSAPRSVKNKAKTLRWICYLCTLWDSQHPHGLDETQYDRHHFDLHVSFPDARSQPKDPHHRNALAAARSIGREASF